VTAVTNILAASAELDHAIKELSKRFDAIENAIASIDNVETRSRLKQSGRLSRETLFSATLQLTQVIGEFIGARVARESVVGTFETCRSRTCLLVGEDQKCAARGQSDAIDRAPRGREP
jgi:hypothetical protein